MKAGWLQFLKESIRFQPSGSELNFHFPTHNLFGYKLGFGSHDHGTQCGENSGNCNIGRCARIAGLGLQAQSQSKWRLKPIVTKFASRARD